MGGGRKAGGERRVGGGWAVGLSKAVESLSERLRERMRQ